jgi:hypothetical protein
MRSTVNDKLPRLPKLPTSLVLLMALAGPPLFVALSDHLFGEFPSLGIQVVLQVFYCGLAGIVIWVVVRHERLPLRSIGVRRPDWSTLVSGALLCGVGLFVLPLITAPLLNAMGTDGLQAGLEKLTPLPTWFRVTVGVTVRRIFQTESSARGGDPALGGARS